DDGRRFIEGRANDPAVSLVNCLLEVEGRQSRGLQALRLQYRRGHKRTQLNTDTNTSYVH
ncbi:MAG: hypothetical protein VW879_15205, partial [Opitutae bacterium]